MSPVPHGQREASVMTRMSSLSPPVKGASVNIDGQRSMGMSCRRRPLLSAQAQAVLLRGSSRGSPLVCSPPGALQYLGRGQEVAHAAAVPVSSIRGGRLDREFARSPSFDHPRAFPVRCGPGTGEASRPSTNPWSAPGRGFSSDQQDPSVRAFAGSPLFVRPPGDVSHDPATEHWTSQDAGSFQCQPSPSQGAPRFRFSGGVSSRCCPEASQGMFRRWKGDEC